MSKILLGKTPEGKWVEVDLELLLRSRLLLQANSGGGKSVTLRLLIEQLFGKVQIIVIDREGEFPSLCDEYDFLLVGQGHDIPADIRSARMLAEKLLELRASAIIDLYEAFRTNTIGRLHWVRDFLNGLVDAPKNLWHDVVVIVDEAHLFCAEATPKAAKMEDREIIQGCKEAMIALATVGRKRGQCAVWATQRLAKLDKDASAELLNRLVGMTFEDTDVDRAIDLMSVSREDRAPFRKSLRELEPGNFYVFGRAITKERTLFKVTKPKTHYEQVGGAKGIYEPPPPSDKVKALLAKLGDLPREVEAKAKTEKELRAENAALKQKLVTAMKQEGLSAGTRVPAKLVVQKVPVEKRVEVPVITPAEMRKLERLAHVASLSYEKGNEAAGTLGHILRGIRHEIEKLSEKGPTPKLYQGFRGEKVPPMKIVNAPPFAPKKEVPAAAVGEEALLAGERKMLGVLAQFHPGSRTKSQLGALSGYTPSGGTFGQYYGKLKRLKLIKEGMGGEVSITEAGLEWFGGEIPEGPRSPKELLEMWRGKLLQGERKMLDTLVQVYPESMTKEELGEKSGYTSSGGTFGQYLGTLRRNALVSIEGDSVKASATFFDFAPGTAI